MNTYLGLDGEMSGTTSSHQLIQIGLAIGARDTLGLDVGWLAGTYRVDPESLQVNGFDHARIQQGQPPEVVDVACVAWLDLRFPGMHAKQLIPVGWNVAGFDMPFVRRDLPKLGARLSYRSVDLNAVCFALDGKVAAGTDGQVRPRSWEWWKKDVKRLALEAMGAGVAKPHDAEWDAVVSLQAFRVLQGIVRG